MSTQPTAGGVPEWTVGDRLRKAREMAHMEKEQLADLIGVSRGTVANYESGATRHMKPIVLRAWAVATGASLHWIETGEPGQGGGGGGTIVPNGPRPVRPSGGRVPAVDAVFKPFPLRHVA